MRKIDKKHVTGRKKKRFRISIGRKAWLVVFFITSALSAIAIFMASKIHTLWDEMLLRSDDIWFGNALAVLVDREAAQEALLTAREIYDSIPEEERSRMDESYFAHFSSLGGESYDELVKKLDGVNNYDYPVKLEDIGLVFLDNENERVVFAAAAGGVKERHTKGYWMTVDKKYYTDGALNEWFRGNAVWDGVEGEAFETFETFETLSPFYRNGTKDDIIGYVLFAERAGVSYVRGVLFLYMFGAVMILSALIMSFLARHLMRRFVVVPMYKLTKAADEYVKMEHDGNEEPIFKNVEIRSNDEIGDLRDSMEQMENEIANYIEEITSMIADKQRIETELDVAAKIQAAMLPNELIGYGGERNFEISSLMKTAREVGGDFYDFFTIDDNHIGLVIADVSGKGVPAAMFMVVSRTIVKSMVTEYPDPSEAIRRTNDKLIEGNEENMFVTLWLGVYTVDERKLVYANAGHEFPAVYRKETGRFELIEEEHDLALGLFGGMEFASKEISLGPGDRFFVYTDGVPEATSDKDEMYGTGRMLDVLNECAKEAGQEVLDFIKCDVDSFVGSAPQFDDMTMLMIDIL